MHMFFYQQVLLGDHGVHRRTRWEQSAILSAMNLPS